MQIKKGFLFLTAMAFAISLSVAIPQWSGNFNVKEIWVAPGPTAVVRIIGSNNGTYVFHLNNPGAPELLKLVQSALEMNLFIKVYSEFVSGGVLYTGLSSPNTSFVSGDLLYSLAIRK